MRTGPVGGLRVTCVQDSGWGTGKDISLFPSLSEQMLHCFWFVHVPNQTARPLHHFR